MGSHTHRANRGRVHENGRAIAAFFHNAGAEQGLHSKRPFSKRACASPSYEYTLGLLDPQQLVADGQTAQPIVLCHWWREDSRGCAARCRGDGAALVDRAFFAGVIVLRMAQTGYGAPFVSIILADC